MACLALLALATALATLTTPSAAVNVCKKDEFNCSNKCVNFAFLCDGLRWCDDGSDLAVCQDSNTTLAVGKFVAVRATVAVHHWYMYLLVCNATECGRLEIEPYSRDDTRLVFTPSTGCGWPQWYSCRQGRFRERTHLRPGAYELVLQRRDSKLAVWQADQPDNVGLVDAPEGGLIVRLRTYIHNNDFRVEFGAPTLALRTATVTPVRDYPDQPTVAPVRRLSWLRRERQRERQHRRQRRRERERQRQHGADSSRRPAQRPTLRPWVQPCAGATGEPLAR